VRPAKLLILAALASVWAGPLGRAAELPAKHFLWKVTGGKGAAYLLGTIHFGNTDLYPLAPVIEQDFNESDELVEEIDLTAGEAEGQAAQETMKTGLYPPGDSIDHHLSEETRTQLATYAKSAGLTPTYTQAKPWLVRVLITAFQLKRMGLDGSEGLDLHFINEAKAAQKPVVGLESVDAQLKLYSSMPDDLQDKLLLQALLDAGRWEPMLKAMLAAWRAGDADAMERVINEDVRTHPSLEPLMQKLLYDRNAVMAQKIEELLQTPKTYFVAIGAGHLVGPKGIVALLGDKGYAIEQE
jgi:hypothetical protein